MFQMVILVLARPEQLKPVMDVWRDAGVSGITVLHTIGMEGIERHHQRDDLPLFPSMRDLFDMDEMHHRTIFTLTDDEQLIERLISETERIIGLFTDKDNGILFTLPVGRIYGLPRSG